MIAPQTARSLAEQFGTPLYAYELDDVDARCDELRSVLPSGAQLFYSLKANPLPALVAATRQAGCRAEVSSTGELVVALEAGHDPASLLFTGPGKSRVEFEHAIGCGVGTISAESWRDLELTASVAIARGASVRVILRVNVARAPQAGLAMAGGASRFGFDEETLERVSARVASLPGVRLAGIHVYLGTQIPSTAALEHAFGGAMEAAEACPRDVDLEIVDLGGGFPWPYASAAEPVELAALARPLAAIERDRRRTARAELWFESGRYVAASSGTLVASVLDVRRSRAKTFVVLDAGIAHLGGMSGLGRVLAPAAELVAMTPAPGAARQVADVVGPLCTPLDCIARGALVPPLAAGDLVAIPNTGAYGATASLTGFLSRPPAVEVALRAGRVVAAARLRTGHRPVAWTTEMLRDDEPLVV